MDTVAALKAQVVDLTGTVKTLKRRIEFIENTLTESQIKELSSKESLDNSEGLILTNKATSEDNSPTEPKTIRNEIVIESTEVEVTDQTNPESDSEFCYPRQQRKNIRRGKSQIQGSKQKSVTGQSNAKHQVKAATLPHSADVSNGPYLVYAGKLAKDTDARSVREHLQSIGVTQIADVIKLNCRNVNQTSFCISVDTKLEEDLVYSADNWPSGVIIRPYKNHNSIKNRGHRNSKGHRRQHEYGVKYHGEKRRGWSWATPRWNYQVKETYDRDDYYNQPYNRDLCYNHPDYDRHYSEVDYYNWY